jgi:hypothetical protein
MGRIGNIRLKYYPSPRRCEYGNKTLDFLKFTFSTRQAGIFSARKVFLYSIGLNYTQVSYTGTGIRRITTFRSTTDRIYDGCPINIIL